MSRATDREYCPTCGHIVAKDMANLSSLEFRRLIHRIMDLDELIGNKDRLYRYIKSSYKVKEFADQFLSDLEDRIEQVLNGDEDEDLNNIKLWLLGFINNEDRAFPPRELDLYKFIYSDDSDINMPFAEFYDNYSQWTENPMSKNRVSRALLAFGLKTTTKKIMCDGKMKSTIMLCASKEELLELCEKNSIAKLTQQSLYPESFDLYGH